MSDNRIVRTCVDELSIWIDAKPEYVWDTALRDINKWWRSNVQEGSLGVFIEPEIGGRFWQKFDEQGSGVLYGTVSYIKRPKALHIANVFGMAGISLWTNTWRLFPQDDGTLFQYTNQFLSELPERYMSGRYKALTRELLASLKKYIETGEIGV
ncbi:hypothetical protein JW859_07490 [bacterium]|nr:hypothetical protein [bacterium]